MHNICEINACTACGACENVCHKKAILRQVKWDGSWYMEIDETQCVNCGSCVKVCPNVQGVELNHPVKAYAAWSNNPQVHATSASGGIAAELYQYAVQNDMYFAGVAMNENQEAHFTVGHTVEEIQKYKNSKYTFSFMDDTYQKIHVLLKERKKVLFIGLPCQVAAIKNYFKLVKSVQNNLLTVDLACHGTPSPEFLKQHISSIEERKSRHAKPCYFRDPTFKTERFMFTLYDQKNQLFYKKKVESRDVYQIGYHSALIYRDCCYQCKYACHDRSGDLTLADYHGLGSLAPYEACKKSVSCVLVNTPKGESFLQSLMNQLVTHERPILEPLKGERQFNQPSSAPEERAEFIKLYIEKKDFDSAADIAFKELKKKNVIKGIVDIRRLRIFVTSLLPRESKVRIKEFLGKR